MFLVLSMIASLFSAVGGQGNYTIVIHGGAGVMSKERMTPEKQNIYLQHLGNALAAAEKSLKNGGACRDAVVAAINYMEDCPLFNAGKGAVFAHNGKNELDASFMDGKTLGAGAVAGVTDIKNPITAARAVMEKSEHVFLSGKGASEFARKQGLEMVPNRYFFTKERYESLRQILKQQRQREKKDNYGTVGCVVVDQQGNLCAGTSTGGMTDKKYGRIGDAPVIGAGTYASNATCAVSCTGHGEYYLRLGFARDISAMVEYKGITVQEACREEIRKLTQLGGTGGVIAVDRTGNIAMEFNTSGMFRGYLKSTGEKNVAIFKD